MCPNQFDVEDNPGALLFTHPEHNNCVKYHLCQDCEEKVLGLFNKNHGRATDLLSRIKNRYESICLDIDDWEYGMLDDIKGFFGDKEDGE